MAERDAEGERTARITRAAHERGLRCTCSIFPWIRRLMAAVDSVGPVVFPPLPRLATLRAAGRPPSTSSLSKHRKDSLPILLCADHERGVRIGTHMSRIPTVFPRVRKRRKNREREARIAVTLWERSRERTKEARAFLSIRTRTRVCGESGTIVATCTHVRALLPRFLGARLSELPARWIDG